MPVRLLAVIFPAHLRSTYSSAPAQTRFQQNLPTSPPDVFVSGQQAVRFGNSPGDRFSPPKLFKGANKPTEVIEGLRPVNDTDHIARVRVTDKGGQSYDLILYFQGTQWWDKDTKQLKKGPSGLIVTGYKTQEYERRFGGIPLEEVTDRERLGDEFSADFPNFILEINDSKAECTAQESRWVEGREFKFPSIQRTSNPQTLQQLIAKLRRLYKSLPEQPPITAAGQRAEALTQRLKAALTQTPTIRQALTSDNVARIELPWLFTGLGPVDCLVKVVPSQSDPTISSVTLYVFPPNTLEQNLPVAETISAIEAEDEDPENLLATIQIAPKEFYCYLPDSPDGGFELYLEGPSALKEPAIVETIKQANTFARSLLGILKQAATPSPQ